MRRILLLVTTAVLVAGGTTAIVASSASTSSHKAAQHCCMSKVSHSEHEGECVGKSHCTHSCPESSDTENKTKSPDLK